MNFWRFNVPDAAYFNEVTASYNHFILFLSLLVSTLTAYSLIVVLKRMWQTKQAETRSMWKWFGSVAFGLGVWAMHFTGMLAYMLPIDMSYSVVLTVLSIIPPPLLVLFLLPVHWQRSVFLYSIFTPVLSPLHWGLVPCTTWVWKP